MKLPHRLAALSLAFAFTAAAAQQPSPRHIVADLDTATTPVDHFYDLSVGSDYPGTLIRPDSMAQLKLVTEELGFRYIRFHAIFHDVLGTVVNTNGKITYNWTKIDELYDDLLARHIKPFVELGFTPLALKTSDNSIFYWKGNTSHPDPTGWNNLIAAFIHHIEQRYGQPEVRSWFFEVWNEPNLSGFWEAADQQAYFSLYDNTSNTIKAIDPQLRVGGPSTAGAAWVPDLLNHVKASGAAIDFVSTHTYGVDGGFLDEKGQSDTKLSPSPDAILGDIRRVRKEISASPFPNLPLYFTEWSTSYTPRDPRPRLLHQRPLYPLQAQSLRRPPSGHELLDLHRPLRRTRPTPHTLPRRLRPPHPRRHPQARLLRLQIPPRPPGQRHPHHRPSILAQQRRRPHRRPPLGLRNAPPGRQQSPLLHQSPTQPPRRPH